jgi:hypothetical protein
MPLNFGFGIRNDRRLYRSFRRNYWRDFKHGNESFAFILLALYLQPSVAAFGLRVSCEIEDFNFSLPDGLALKLLMHWHSANINSRTLVKVLDWRPGNTGIIAGGI